jgi:hypothetical protein
MRKLIKTTAFLLIIFAGVSGTSANAQTARRIQFGKGKTSAVVRSTTGEYGVLYVIRAKSGQKLVLYLTPGRGVGIKVETNGRFGEMTLLREEKGGHYEVGVEESGDHTIFIGSNNNKPVTFTLTVRVTKLADI